MSDDEFSTVPFSSLDVNSHINDTIDDISNISLSFPSHEMGNKPSLPSLSVLDITNISSFSPLSSSTDTMGLNIDALRAIPKGDFFSITITYHWEYVDKDSKHHQCLHSSHTWELDVLEIYLLLVSIIYPSRSWEAYYRLHQAYETDLNEFWNIEHQWVAGREIKFGASWIQFDKNDIKSNDGYGLGSFMVKIYMQYHMYKRRSLVNPRKIPTKLERWINSNLYTILERDIC